MAYLFGVFSWIGFLVYCIYNWNSVKPNSFMNEIAYFSVVLEGILGTIASLVYFVLVFWYKEKFKYMLITLSILVFLCIVLVYPLLF